ncbi:MAG: hypothetical protein HQL45_12595 [Alphaproteobacteria bacterium]|nr:hypothetical protein [Alphaproteobacteria bacterium]
MATLRKIENDPTALSDAEWKAIEQGRADFAEGRYIDHETMSAWLKSWGTDPLKPSPSPKTAPKDK